MDSRLKANDGEVIDVLQIDCEKSLYGNFYIEISFRRFGIADDTTVTFYEDTKKACIDLFNRIMRKININM